MIPPADGAYIRWAALRNEGLGNLGMTDCCYPERMKEQMESEGFVNVQIRSYYSPVVSIPIENRQKEAGTSSLKDLIDGISGLSLKVFLELSRDHSGRQE